MIALTRKKTIYHNIYEQAHRASGCRLAAIIWETAPVPRCIPNYLLTDGIRNFLEHGGKKVYLRGVEAIESLPFAFEMIRAKSKQFIRLILARHADLYNTRNSYTDRITR